MLVKSALFSLVVLPGIAAWPVACALAGDAQIEARGRSIAAALCSDCHAIGANDETPSPVNANTAFRMLHERYPIEMLVEAAKSGTISGHDEMPAFDLSPSDMQALLAYIDSFTPDRPGYATGAATSR